MNTQPFTLAARNISHDEFDAAAACSVAAKEGVPVVISYHSDHHDFTGREVTPQTVWRDSKGRLLLTGYCHLREDFRTFGLDGVRTIYPARATKVAPSYNDEVIRQAREAVAAYGMDSTNWPYTLTADANGEVHTVTFQVTNTGRNVEVHSFNADPETGEFTSLACIDLLSN